MKKYVILLLAFVFNIMQSFGQSTDPAVVQKMKTRELSVGAGVKTKLTQIRANVVSKNLGFEVACTKAGVTGVKKLSGLKVNKAKQKSLKAIKPKVKVGSIGTPVPTENAWSWGYNSPSRNQLECGSCWAYSIATAIETNYAKQYGTASSYPYIMHPDVSEQFLLNCNSGAGDCNGGDPTGVLDWLVTSGQTVGLEGDTPYIGYQQSCSTSKPTSIKVKDWGYVDPSNEWSKIPTVAQIKQAIVKYGSVCTTIYATDAFAFFSGGVFKEIPSGDASIMDSGDPLVNHAINIVGWSDGHGAWLVRNSWGEDWGGYGGMGYVAYNTNNIGVLTNWVQTEQANPNKEVFISAYKVGCNSPTTYKVDFNASWKNIPSGTRLRVKVDDAPDVNTSITFTQYNSSGGAYLSGGTLIFNKTSKKMGKLTFYVLDKNMAETAETYSASFIIPDNCD